MADDQVSRNLKGMDDLDFVGWNGADWGGVFADHHTDDVTVDWHGAPPTASTYDFIASMCWSIPVVGGTPPQVVAHPIAFGGGDWTCVVGELENGSRMVTVAKWVDGRIVEEHIWA